MGKGRFLLGVFIIGGAFLLFQYAGLLGQPWLIALIENTVSRDGSVSCLACLNEILTQGLFGALLIWIGFFLLSPVLVPRFSTLASEFSKSDVVLKLAYAAMLLVVVSYFLAIGGVLPFHPLFGEDRLFEWGSTLLILFSVLMLARSIPRANGFSRRLLVLGALVLAFVAMEEISWGQRIFGFQSPAWFQGINIKGEVNLHNLISSRALGLLTDGAFVLLGFLIVYRDWAMAKLAGFAWGEGFAPFVPTPDQVWFGAVLVFSSVSGANRELQETIFALWLAIYCLSVFRAFRQAPLTSSQA